MIKCFLTALLILCVCLNLSLGQIKSTSAKNKNDDVEQLRSEIIDALSNNNLNLAKTILQKLLDSEPQNVTVQTLAGIVADRDNDLPSAEKHFAIAARLSPQSPATRNNYGAILLRLNRKNESAREFLASLAINPNQPSSLVNLAQIRFTENNLEAARELLEKAAAIDADAGILHSLLLISLQLKENTRASQDFKKYLAKLKSDPAKKNSERELAAGRALQINNLLDEAKELFEFILANDAGNVDGLVQLSQIYLQLKRLPDAGKLLESAVARGVTDAKVYFALAVVYQSGGYFENAVPAMLLAIEKDPKNELYYARYGLLLIDAKAPAAAIIRLSEAVKQFPNSAKILLALGIAQIYDGQPVQARNSLEHALQIEPNSVPVLAYLADISVTQAQYADALKFYQLALNIEESAVLHYLVADTLLKIPESNQGEIQKHLLRSIALDEKLAQAHFALGKVYARDEKWEIANNEFEKATRYAPELSEAFYQLGRTLARLKKTEESKAAFDQYKKLNETLSVKSETDRQSLVRRLANVKF